MNPLLVDKCPNCDEFSLYYNRSERCCDNCGYCENLGKDFLFNNSSDLFGDIVDIFDDYIADYVYYSE